MRAQTKGPSIISTEAPARLVTQCAELAVALKPTTALRATLGSKNSLAQLSQTPNTVWRPVGQGLTKTGRIAEVGELS